MSLKVIKAGIADSFQDEGRFGYQHLGINPNGAMDLNAMRIANALVGNKWNETLVELNFPAASFRFQRAGIIALSGADFSARLNRIGVPLNRPVWVPEGSELRFNRAIRGSLCYLALHGGFQLRPWLGSASTNVKANVGGFEGRFFRNGDVIEFKSYLQQPREAGVLPWSANVSEFYANENVIRCLTGHEWDGLIKKSKTDFQTGKFMLSPQSDRMGYRMKGVALKQKRKQELLSTAVTFGTVQLLPSGEIIILMADHQTTGGYPRIAHVISADRSRLAQFRPNDSTSFQIVSLEEAEEFAIEQSRSLKQLEGACKQRLHEFLHPDK